MNSLEIPNLENISSLVEKIKSGEINVVDLIKTHLVRAHEVQEKTNAFITILDEYAIKRAEEWDRKIQETRNKKQEETEDLKFQISNLKLLGVPFTVKDLYLVEGTRTTFSSKYMEDFIAPYTSTVAQKCIDEGAILIAKCNCDPWGFGGSGENSGYGPTKHPLDFTKTPGGSSSGSGASLLAGVGYFSLGTDTGGSVRLPASFCGLYGIKPTYGRNSRYGIGSMGSSFDTPGFFTRHIEDVKLLEEIMEGRDERDGTTYTLDAGRLTQDARNEKQETRNEPLSSAVSTSNLKVGVPKEFFGEGIDPEVRKAIEIKIEDIKSKGYEVKEVSIPSASYGLSVYYILVPSEISSNRARYDGVRFGKKVSDDYEENMIKGRSEYFEDEVKRRIMIGTYALSKGYADQFYKKASMVRTKLKREFDKVFEEVDFLIAPVSPTTAFKLGEKSNDPVQMYLVDVYTVTANLVGIPALNVPIGNDKDGMPIGMQIMGQRWKDYEVIEFGGKLKVKSKKSKVF